MSTEPTPTDLEKETSAEASAAPETAAAPEEPAEETGPTPSLARTTVNRIGTGGRHAAASLRHILTTGHQSDDEIRRLLVQRQFGAYEEVRDTAREELDVVHSRITRLERIGAEDGWTPEQRQEVKVLREERKGRTAALKDLMKAPFEPVQPTADQIKRARRAGSTRRFVALLVVIGLLGALLVSAPQLLLLVLPAAVAVLWWLGRRPPTLVQRPVPDRLLAQPELALSASAGTTAAGAEEGPAPYAIADASTSEEAEEALRRAIVHEGGDLRDVTDGRREPWGWSARARFRTGSPDSLNEDKTYRNLITLLRLRRNGLLIEADPEAGDTCTVRMLVRSPFTPELVGSVPYRTPLSATIRDPFDLGVGMDTTKLMFSLAGLMLLMVGDSGSGKSGVMLAMAEAVTSTRDAVLINIDPAGTGVGDLGPAITLNACMDQDRIAAVFDFLHQLCSARARQRMAYGWGNKWRVSEEHPAMCVFVDEWPQLSEKNKKRLIKLLILARKEAIWFYAGSQFGTKDYLGDAIGPKLSGKLLGASRRVDTTELLGGGAIAEGYRSDLLRAATETDPGDAGQIYAHGLPGMANRPMRYQVREITPEHAARVGAERAAAGLPDVTHTLTEAGMIKDWNKLLKAEATVPVGPSAGGGDDELDVPHVLMIIAEAFVQEDDPEYLTLDQVHRYLRKDDAAKWGRWDDRDDQGRLRELGKALARELAKAKVQLSSERITEVEGQPRGFYAAAVQRALADDGS
uniref:FtsK domain-containing protein n=1 Tax=Streptomyces sp. NBC_00093 TaxID=2975649 RepID=A0AAU2AGR7_9ACTN